MHDVECGFPHADEAVGCRSLIIEGPVIDVQIGFDPNFDSKNTKFNS